ncbi:Arm DNA-binding domain-containing protein [Faecalimonas umbilicata]|uniref:Arm DNA-binding domain-containing protein n=1 Tax=Faecalimonas umbilicata TaxID=1912855 RepID=UPI003A7F4A81
MCISLIDPEFSYYKDWTGVRKQKTKRGFKRKCDAQECKRQTTRLGELVFL